jgi:hypothetical protein
VPNWAEMIDSIDIGDPVHDFVSDVTGGAFRYNAGGTAAVGVNHVTHQDEEVSQMGLTWVGGPS